MSKHPSRVARALLMSLAAGGLVLLAAPVASADPGVASAFTFDGVLAADGTLAVTQTIAFDDAAPDELVQRIATKQRVDDNSYYTYDVTDVRADLDGADADARVTTDGDYVVVTLDTSAADGKDVTISYAVQGATRTEKSSTGDLTVLSWRVLQGLSVEVDAVSGTVRVPGVPELVDCTAGPPGTVDKCALYAAGTTASPQPNFQTSARGPGEQVTFTVGVAAAAVAPTATIVDEWSLDRAFTLTPLTAAIALGALLLGGALIWQLYRRIGVDDAASADAPIATFTPVAAGESVFTVADDLRPGLVGTVATERVDPVDVTSTLLDLAVRGHLLITELPRAEHGLLDWSLTRTQRNEDQLLPFEHRILEAIAPVGGSTTVSQLPATLAPVIADVQDSLYDEVVSRGWFEARPDATRGQWRTRGIAGIVVAVVAAVALVAFTRLGLLALVLLLLAAGLLWVADRMPRRTARGSRLMGGLAALSSLLATHPMGEMPKGREIAEISRVLPYAVVLGGKDRWLQAMVLADDDVNAPDPTTIDWYHAPDTWHLQDLPVSLTQFISTVQGVLFGR
ncbi:DUF2207 family protein [Tessaracoccus antarcticus]|uniref:DUF2207 domain-containing protein n=1 Tax=Tessaracoccus antarcticus TaxID=2479848 RepID=A0A3M0GAW7_9ACTN|nr:DUF2207 domain-containing protein [Tessaracoccus antarcticus]RMB62064.1 DUF2207 domain-containing protein [Tessaracoccus antarcticus]